jgi:tetratricopeptide (TPR) repeat protein
MPPEDRLPPGPLRDLVQDLHELYRAAGTPSARRLSNAIRDDDAMPDTVSHETVSGMLRGELLPRWQKVECVVRTLVAWAVDPRPGDSDIRRWFRLWSAAHDEALHDLGAAQRLPWGNGAPSGNPIGAVNPGYSAPPANSTPVEVTPAVLDRPRPEPPARRLGLHSSEPPPTRIVGELPKRNEHFTGRDALFDILREQLTTRPLPPVVLYGLGGVGKTQVAIEYLHRNLDRYDIVWWIPAEQPARARASLCVLGDRLDLPAHQDRQQTVRTVLGYLETTSRRWVLVYDNAEDPEEVQELLPTMGGHTILTSRNPEWTGVARPVEIDVFGRAESIQFLRRRGDDVSGADADRLAARLGDLPLALEQLVTIQAVGGNPLSAYLQLVEHHLDEVLASGKPSNYPMTVAALLHLAFEGLRDELPTAPYLFELFAYLAPEPVSVSLLRSGRHGDISPPLRRILENPMEVGRAIQQLARYGLVKVDAQSQRIEVHRIVQLWLQEALDEESRHRSRTNVHQLLVAANPGQPDDLPTWDLHAEIAPHVLPAGLIEAEDPRARRVVLDQMRFLYLAGDYEATRRLGEQAVSAWSASTGHGNLGPDDELTLLATRDWANALRDLGDYTKSRQLTVDALSRLQASPRYGAAHPHTLMMGRSVGPDLRIAGQYRAALDVDRANLRWHRSVYGEKHPDTVSVMSSLAVDMRMTGDFVTARRYDEDVLSSRHDELGPHHRLTLLSDSNLARDLYGLGRYAEALERQRGSWPVYRDQLGSRHNDVLLAARTIAIALRKTGRYSDALARAEDNYRSYHGRFGADHEHTLAATMSYANALCAVGRLDEARNLATEAVATYQRMFGMQHPLTLAAVTNQAVILRALGVRGDALTADTAAHEQLRAGVGDMHPYTLSAATNLATDFALHHEYAAALALSKSTLITATTVRGASHPDTLVCAANLAQDYRTAGDTEAGDALLDDTLTALRRALGPDHPTVVAVARGERVECDIEPPPS